MRHTNKRSRTWRAALTIVCYIIWKSRYEYLKHRTAVDYLVFDGQVAQLDDHIEAAVKKGQHQHEALVGYEMRTLNHFINML